MKTKHPYTATCCACRCMSQIIEDEAEQGFMSKARVQDIYKEEHIKHEGRI